MGYCVFVGGSIITWKSKMQIVLSMSCVEPEYKAITELIFELVRI